MVRTSIRASEAERVHPHREYERASTPSPRLGTAGLGVALLSSRHLLLLRVAGALGGLVAWWLTYLAVDGMRRRSSATLIHVLGDT